MNEKYEYYRSSAGIVYAVNEKQEVFYFNKEKKLVPSKSGVDPYWEGLTENEKASALNESPYKS